jgi:hypothetical protein
MDTTHRPLLAFFAALILSLPMVAASNGGKTTRNQSGSEGEGPAVLWSEPQSIPKRDLFYGPGGKDHVPKGTFTFVAEDMNGSNPKFDVVDEAGVKWTVKLGEEARPETAAARIVWAVGYFANEDYLMPILHVENMPKLRRGANLVASDGTMRDVRLKRHSKEEKKLGNWMWADNPFVDTREWYGLRALMAVINNWDLKDSNNAVLQVRGDHPEQLYLVSDLGSSFGSPGLNWERKGSLKAYTNSKMIKRASPEFIDFHVPARPKMDTFVNVPELTKRLGLLWLGERIPIEDVKWVGRLLAQLSPQQIRDAFRAAGYSAEDAEAFSSVLEQRIAELGKL